MQHSLQSTTTITLSQKSSAYFFRSYGMAFYTFLIKSAFTTSAKTLIKNKMAFCMLLVCAFLMRNTAHGQTYTSAQTISVTEDGRYQFSVLGGAGSGKLNGIVRDPIGVSANGNWGGTGATITADFFLLTGDFVYVIPGAAAQYDFAPVGGGGGGSAVIVKRGGSFHLLIVAGGGGGGGYTKAGLGGSISNYNGTQTAAGGTGDVGDGGGGGGVGAGFGGGAGNNTGGGYPGIIANHVAADNGFSNNASNGGSGFGGGGGAGVASMDPSTPGGGGGGGGYSGGKAGGPNTAAAGGTSYVNNTEAGFSALYIRASAGVDGGNTAYSGNSGSVTVTVLPKPPTVSSFNPLQGKPGNLVTITGTNFSTTPANNTVFIGATKAAVTAATTTSLDITVPAGATNSVISVLNTETNLIAYSKNNFTPIFKPVKSTIALTDFAARVNFTTGTNPGYVTMGDLDGDGLPDMVTTNQADHTVSVFLNTSSQGSPTFATDITIATGQAPQGVAIGDIDGDGKPDMAVTSYNGNLVSIYRNTSTQGNISFAAKVDIALGSCPFFVVIRDIDGDGRADLVTANKDANTISVVLNTGGVGAISFAARVDLATGNKPYSVTVGDLDGDGKPDVAAAAFDSNNMVVFRNTSTVGLVSFDARQDFAVITPYSISIGDLDGDGKSDLVTGNLGANNVSMFRNTSVVGTISFAAKSEIVIGQRIYNVAIGDLDGDGKNDLVTSNYTNNTVSILRNMSNSGSISFATQVALPTGAGPNYVAIADMDLDDKPDLLVSNYDDNTLSLILNVNPPKPNENGTIYVKQNGAGNFTGDSWANAIPQLADALKFAKTNNAVMANAKVTQIWVAKGIYKPTYSPEDGAKFGTNQGRNNAFLLVKDVKVYGGFEGTEATLADRNLRQTANKVVLSGDFNGDDGAGFVHNDENAFHIVISAGEVGTASLDGFTITGANANEATQIQVNSQIIAANNGAGVSNYLSSPFLSNINITANKSIKNGGGMNNSSSSPTLLNVIISGNKAGTGGAMFNENASPSLINATIVNNSGLFFGGSGGIQNSSSSPIIRNSIIFGNGANIKNIATSAPEINYSLVQGLTATTDGNIDATGIALADIFTDATNGDFTLKLGSPVANKGSNIFFAPGQTPDLSAFATDLAGNPRLQKGTIDLGAYESAYSPTPVSDVNGIIYVKLNGAGDFTGRSWANAIPEFADALKFAKTNNAVTTNAQVTQVWTADGTYKPMYSPEDGVNFGTNQGKSNAFLLVKDVKLFGGFAGTETDLAQRDLSLMANKTILSGDFNGNDGASFITTVENAYHVVISAGHVGTALLNGFTISGGTAYNINGSAPIILVNTQSINGSNGAGVYNDASSPVLTHVNISGNYAAANGGGLYNGHSSSPILNSVTINKNRGNQGAGVYNDASSPILTNVVISGNKASVWGGGIFNSSASPVLTNITISGNSADYAGAAMYNDNSFPNLRNSIIYANKHGILNVNSSTPIISYSLVQGLAEDAINHNLDGATDPLFANAPNAVTAPFNTGDYTLKAGSPTFNIGSNTYFAAGQTPELSLVATDLGGNTRIQKGKIDLGAYESAYSPTPVPNATGVVYVKKDGAGNFSGDSWANATDKLQYGIDATGVSQVWVAKGTYQLENETSYAMKNGVAIYGGFAGIETNLTDRNWATNETILKGNNASVIKNNFTSTTPLTDAAVLDGFTIKGGATDYGSGVYNLYASATFVHVKITENGRPLSSGGGMFNDNSSPTLTQVSIIGNDTGDGSGGGMYNQYASSPILTNVTIANNKAANGGAMANYATNPVIRNSVIYGNTSGIINNDGATPVIMYSLVQGVSSTANNNLDGTSANYTLTNLFTNATTGDYTLKTGSAVINKGSNALYFGTLTTDKDLAGNNRLVDVAIDLGAYENQTITVLPVNFGKFTVSAQSNRIKLDWNTFSETNNNSFIIYRSTDGLNYTEIITQGSKGGNANSYSNLDNGPANGLNYYRLSQKDNDGTIIKLADAVVNFSLANAEIKAWPNPVTNILNLSFMAGKFQTVKLVDVTGKKLLERNVISAQSEMQIDMSTYPKGIYIVELRGSQGYHLLKVIK